MRILKFKSQLTIGFFAAVNHGLWFVIGGFRSVLCVSVFQGSLLVIVIMIDGSEKRNCEGGFLFTVRMFVKSAVKTFIVTFNMWYYTLIINNKKIL